MRSIFSYIKNLTTYTPHLSSVIKATDSRDGLTAKIIREIMILKKTYFMKIGVALNHC